MSPSLHEENPEIPVELVGTFACLKVVDVTAHGVFMDVGFKKDLLIPNKLQRNKMNVGEWHLVRIEQEEETGRLYGNAKASPHVDAEDIDLMPGQIASLVPYLQTPLGYKTLIDGKYSGMAFHNEIFFEVTIGNEYQGTVTKIRPDGHIDVLLKVRGGQGHREDADQLLEELTSSGGTLYFSAASSPQEIYQRFGMSKKSFKQALGNLYKRRLIIIHDDCFKLTELIKSKNES